MWQKKVLHAYRMQFRHQLLQKVAGEQYMSRISQQTRLKQQNGLQDLNNININANYY